MKNYLKVKYSIKDKPFTSYPENFVRYNITNFDLRKKTILEIGCGRGEFINEFYKQGLKCYAVDIDPGSKKFLDPKIKFKIFNLEKKKLPYSKEKFDIVYSKSLIEHLASPEKYIKESWRVLKKNGILLTYTPDWENQFKNFYDDITHIKPFTLISLKEIHLFNKFNNCSVKKFYQLPITWKIPYLKFFFKFISLFVPIRSKIKLLRFSKELMLQSVAYKKN